MELTRSVVRQEMRGLGLYRLLMLESVLRLPGLNATIATGAIEPDFFGRRFLQTLGFADVGEPLLFYDAPRAATRAQCISVAVTANKLREWRASWNEQRDALAARGWRLDSDLDGEDRGLAARLNGSADRRPRALVRA
jgi:hypothetical protein